MTPDIGAYSTAELASAIRRGEVSPIAAVEHSLTQIDEGNDALNAIVTLLDDEAVERAEAAQHAVESGDSLGPLHGVPIVIKDLFDFKAGVRNTIGSAVFADFVPEETVPYVQRLEDAGAIVVGKGNTPEFGHKGTTDNQLFGPTSTPFDLDRNAGGSSGGPAAAVAAGLVPVAQGTDGGGSVRIPAAWCGVLGFKPSYGRVPQVSRPDAFMSHTPFIHAGPLARTVEDAAIVADVMCGPHPRDPFSVPDEEPDFQSAVRRGVEGLTIGYSPHFDDFPVDPRVRSVVDEAVDAFETAGATVERAGLDLGHSHTELTDLWIREIGGLYHSAVEGFKDDGLDLLADHREELSPEFAAMLEQTRDQTLIEAKRDDHVRSDVFDALQNAFERYDLLVTPTLAVPPVENAGEDEGETVGPTEVDGEPVDPLIGWCLTHPINMTGHPAASVPAGLTDDGLPVGMQVIGRRFADEDVFAAAGAIERVRPWREHYRSAPGAI
ncbi:glutamyl-tRNA amidotransferase subunit A [Salinarchaeum sp. Harcht-Bsk1]|uniref:amidase n=1 Tax=Salinarchaeum sp. Harcht-Bsk1 TaxID=1333523 RepID=UPI0003423BF0|nr:amidase [Salinarchaeum sp. Harcht-Bsk1]AGN01868.1 glutamyl-tRNA amidotransferase subunit A [Salinarchaeum sp. Harcht-Bsk1]